MTTDDTNSSSLLFENDSTIPELTALNVFKWASAHLGCQEAALKLIFSLVIGYPICIVYNLLLMKQPLLIKHLYFIICGVSMGFFNYGINFLHTTLTLVIVYLFITLFRNKFISVLLTFSFCTTYLLWGYWRTQSDEYTFEWTIPQCVLTLRLIAVAFDVYDGDRIAGVTKRDADSSGGGGDANSSRKVADTIKNDEAMFKPPTFIQLAAHSYFPASFMVGPQFGIKRYLNFVNVRDSFVSIRYVCVYRFIHVYMRVCANNSPSNHNLFLCVCPCPWAITYEKGLRFFFSLSHTHACTHHGEKSKRKFSLKYAQSTLELQEVVLKSTFLIVQIANTTSQQKLI